MSKPYVVYIRRSLKREGDADVSDETQEAVARGRVRDGAIVEVIRDSGGHHSGYSADRPGYQRLIYLIRCEAIAGVAAFDDSRLNRNAENALALYRECAAHGIRLLTSDTPPEALFSSTGKTVYGIGALISEQYRNDQSARMKAMAVRTFEQGGHRGGDPFGYTTARDEIGRVIHPRRLVVAEPEAEVVRQIFRDLVASPFSEVSDRLNARGSLRPAKGFWTSDAVKAVWDRRWIYRGHVTRGHRHRDHRPGRHQPIISEEELQHALAGIEARQRGRDKSTPPSQRIYLLSGLAYCSCGARMRGDARVRHGREYRYLACPISDGRGRRLGPSGQPLTCHQRRMRAEVAENRVLEEIGQFALAAQEQNQAGTPSVASQPDLAGYERARMEARLENLRKQHEWGDISDDVYRRGRDEAERQLMLVSITSAGTTRFPGADFLSIAQSPAGTSMVQKGDIVRLLVERVLIEGRAVRKVVWRSSAAGL